jgi:hypothetical protein
MNLPKLNLTPQKKMLIILLAITLAVTIGGALAVNYILTASTPQTYTADPTPTPAPSPTPPPETDVNIQVYLSLSKQHGYYNEPLLLTASITDLRGDGKTVNFYDGATKIGTETLSNGYASITISSMTVGSHTFTAGP